MTSFKNNRSTLLICSFLTLPLIFTLVTVLTNELRHLSSFFLFFAVFGIVSFISFYSWKKTIVAKKLSKRRAVLIVTFLSMFKYLLLGIALSLSFVFDKQLSWEVGICLIALLPIWLFVFKVQEKWN